MDKKLEARIARLEKILNRKNEDRVVYDPETNPWTPDPKDSDVLDAALISAYNAAKKIAQQAKKESNDDECILTWKSIVSLIQDVIDYLSDPDFYNDGRVELSKPRWAYDVGFEKK